MSQVNVLSIQNLVAIVKSNNKCKILKEFPNNPHIPIYLEIRMPDFIFSLLIIMALNPPISATGVPLRVD